MDTETECYIRDKDNIDDFIYEIDSGYGFLNWFIVGVGVIYSGVVGYS